MVETTYQVMPPLTADEYAELKSDIEQRGVMVPVEYDEDGNILDGHHRVQICEELGITDFPKIVRTGFTDAEKRTHARKLNMARRQLNRAQIEAITKQQIQETPELSDRQIARGLGGLVSNPTVSKYRKELEDNGELLKFNSSIGADGKERPRQVERTVYTDDEPDNEIQYSDDDAKEALYHLDELMEEHPILSELVQPRPSLDELLASHDDNTTFYDHAKSAIGEPEHRPHVTANSGNNEWYTPSQYIEIAREVLGEIDLDPASCEFANRTVKANQFYSIEDDGLTKPWHGKVWLNPPYSADLVSKFSEKLVNEYNDGNVTEAIVLVNNATETAWFGTLISEASAVVFPRGRIRYTSPTRDSLTPLQGQAFVYFGEYPQLFMQAFSEVGWGAIVNR